MTAAAEPHGDDHHREISFGLPDRLKKARRTYRPRVTALMVANHHGVERSTVTNWENGHTRPTRGVVRWYAERFGVDYDYLLTGSNPGPDLRDNDSRCMTRGYSYLAAVV